MKYKQRTGKPDARGQIRNRVSIEDRPSIVGQKIRLGDWEADTVIGKGHKGVLVTLTERVSKLNLVKRVPSKHADVVTKAIITMLKPYQPDLLTITFDNGKEFAFHDKTYIKAYIKVPEGFNFNQLSTIILLLMVDLVLQTLKIFRSIAPLTQQIVHYQLDVKNVLHFESSVRPYPKEELQIIRDSYVLCSLFLCRCFSR